MVERCYSQLPYSDRNFPLCCKCANCLWRHFCCTGDLIVADDDGAAVIPQQHIEEFSGSIGEYHEWEEFSRIQLEKGGDLQVAIILFLMKLGQSMKNGRKKQ